MRNKNFNTFLREFIDDDLFSKTFTEIKFPNLNYGNVNRREHLENTPPTNIYEDEWSYRYELSTPGFTKKEINITLNDNNLEIKGERKLENKKDKGEYVSKEYHSNRFFRSFNLPDNIVLDEVHAKVENGIAVLYLPKVTKTKFKKSNRTIEIT